MSDTHVYEFLGLLCHGCMHYTESNEYGLERLGTYRTSSITLIQLTSLAEQLTHLVSSCLPRLRELKQEDDNPKVVAMRRHTLKAWQTTTNELNRSRLTRRDTAWRPFSLLWQRVGTLIPPVPDLEADEAAFDVLQRCGWSECLCNVHKPAHRMRVCKGCWVIAYCGAECQKKYVLRRVVLGTFLILTVSRFSDWEKGGHRKHCRKHRG